MFPATMELALLALLMGVVLGVPLGVVAATHRGRWQDHLVRLVSLFGYSMPVFWLGLVGLLLFYAKLGWVEGPGRIDVGYEDVVPTVTGLMTVDACSPATRRVRQRAFPPRPAGFDPWLSVAAYVARMTRSFMLGQLRQEYVLAALAKGL